MFDSVLHRVAIAVIAVVLILTVFADITSGMATLGESVSMTIHNIETGK